MTVPEFTSFREYRGSIVVMCVIGPTSKIKEAERMARADAKRLAVEELKNTGKVIRLTEVSGGWTVGPKQTETRLIFSIREV